MTGLQFLWYVLYISDRMKSDSLRVTENCLFCSIYMQVPQLAGPSALPFETVLIRGQCETMYI